jgi:hypothetical protein
MKMMILSDEVRWAASSVVMVYSHDETVLVVRDDVRIYNA